MYKYKWFIPGYSVVRMTFSSVVETDVERKGVSVDGISAKEMKIQDSIFKQFVILQSTLYK